MVDMNWNHEDQEILEWLFPVLADEPPPRPLTPDCPEPARLYPTLMRTRALSPSEWATLMSEVF